MGNAGWRAKFAAVISGIGSAGDNDEACLCPSESQSARRFVTHLTSEDRKVALEKLQVSNRTVTGSDKTGSMHGDIRPWQ